MEKSFLFHEKDGLEYYTVPAFEQTNLVVHAFSGRNGGFSEGPFGTLNLGILTEDNPAHVVRNRQKICGILGLDPLSLVVTQQVHGDVVYKVTQADRGRGATDRDSVILGVDALMTNEPGVTLTSYYADCVPVMFLDPVLRVIAVAHAGWKGTLIKIAAKTVQAMAAEYGCRPETLFVAIGPSIGPCHFEVDAPVLQMAKEAFPVWGDALLEKNRESGKIHLNLWEANRRQLWDVGVPDEHITMSGLCTFCLPERFFSHRAGMPGRQAMLLALKEQ